MITRIDISNFGSFKNFIWKNSIKDDGKNVQYFKRLNIIYGRNYSGKTTLSRIFRAIQTGKIPTKYSAPSFAVYGNKGDINSGNILNHNYEIRVYNRDFITDNLSFLVNQTDGEIKTFAIVGEKNKEIENSISRIEAELGSIDSGIGLRFELENNKRNKDQAKTNLKSTEDALAEKLRKHANEKIKVNRDYGSPVYNIDSIKKDIIGIQRSSFQQLSNEERTAKSALLKQDVLPEITNKIGVTLKGDTLLTTAERLLQRKITPTQPIQDLLNDSVLQTWVRSGIPLHKEKRSTCAFCQQQLPHDLWQVLDSHFSKETEDLDKEIDACIRLIEDEIKLSSNLVPITPEQFYVSEFEKFETIKKDLNNDLDIYRQDLEGLKVALEQRKAGIFNLVEVPQFKSNAKSIGQHIETIRALIVLNNGRSETLGKDKESARIALRMNDVADFIATIEYDKELTRIAVLKNASIDADNRFNETEMKVIKLQEEITTLRGRQKDERKGADRVNSLLNHFFGHDGIKLETIDSQDKTSVRFEVTRDGKSAYNLSEGECSLIAFCYFIAKLEEPDTKGKELILFIDDPISSLDSNHIFFVFSLIESLITRPIKNDDGSNRYRYSQLFISTHNLDFLKYLKKISMPNEKNHGGFNHFIVEHNGTSSNILLMPSYLKDYITEFNYLFHQIYKCRDQEYAKVNHEPFYSFGNNLRKFLEAFLFYKYPYHDDKNDSLERIKKFFGDDDTAVVLANRLNNEFSHLEASFDRSIKPVEIPEIPKLANYVLDKIHERDPDQYNALLKSIGEPERSN